MIELLNLWCQQQTAFLGALDTAYVVSPLTTSTTRSIFDYLLIARGKAILLAPGLVGLHSQALSCTQLPALYVLCHWVAVAYQSCLHVPSVYYFRHSYDQADSRLLLVAVQPARPRLHFALLYWDVHVRELFTLHS